MAIIQVGFLGNKGPVFVNDALVEGKYVLLQGGVVNGVMRMQAVQPAYATALGSSFPYTAAQCSLGPYTDLQDAGVAPAYTQPATLPGGFELKADSWTAPSGTTGLGNTTSTGGTGTGGTGTTPTPTTGTGTGGTGTGGTSTDTSIFGPANATSEVETFLSKYWWAVLLVAIALLWKPVIAPALGIKTSRRRR